MKPALTTIQIELPLTAQRDQQYTLRSGARVTILNQHPTPAGTYPHPQWVLIQIENQNNPRIIEKRALTGGMK